MAYLEECTTFEQRLNLSAEIGRLHDQNKAIDRMPFTDLKEDIHDYTIQVKSIFPDNENNNSQKTNPRHQRNERVS